MIEQLIDDILARAKAHTDELRGKPEYQAALQDRIITDDELAYLGLLEGTRQIVYRPDTEGIIDRIWEAFGQVVKLPPAQAEERFYEIENKLSNHNNALRWEFGQYAHKFPDRKQ